MVYIIFADMHDGKTSTFNYTTNEIDLDKAASECERLRRVTVLEIKRGDR
jgi:hypothetical protein